MVFKAIFEVQKNIIVIREKQGILVQHFDFFAKHIYIYFFILIFSRFVNPVMKRYVKHLSYAPTQELALPSLVTIMDNIERNRKEEE